MNRTSKALVKVAITVGLSVLSGCAHKSPAPKPDQPKPAQSPGSPLESGFKDPPDSAKPRVWWHWTGGNVTKTGITKDLEWMKRVGIGGAQMADIGQGGGQTITNSHHVFHPRVV